MATCDSLVALAQAETDPAMIVVDTDTSTATEFAKATAFS